MPGLLSGINQALGNMSPEMKQALLATGLGMQSGQSTGQAGLGGLSLYNQLTTQATRTRLKQKEIEAATEHRKLQLEMQRDYNRDRLEYSKIQAQAAEKSADALAAQREHVTGSTSKIIDRNGIPIRITYDKDGNAIDEEVAITSEGGLGMWRASRGNVTTPPAAPPDTSDILAGMRAGEDKGLNQGLGELIMQGPFNAGKNFMRDLGPPAKGIWDNVNQWLQDNPRVVPGAGQRGMFTGQ